MDRKINGQTAAFIKRRAKSIKKNSGITHNQALDEAAVIAGFSSWKHFIKLEKGFIAAGEEKKKVNPRKLTAVPGNKTVVTSSFRKLLIAGTNELLKAGKISLKAEIQANTEANEQGYIFTKIFGYDSVVLWRDIGWDEILISVWWKYDHSKHPQADLLDNQREEFRSSEPLADRKDYKKFVGAILSGWLERREGIYLMGRENESIVNRYMRSGEREILQRVESPMPLGFGTEGKFII